MADTDPWLGVAWKVYSVQGAGGHDLKPSGKEGSFTLSAMPATANGQAAYYQVHFDGDNMPRCWQNLMLYPRGKAVLAPPSPPLPMWQPSVDGLWLAAADIVRQRLSDSMARLEGALYPDVNSGKVTLVCVPNATTGGTPLLVLKVSSGGASGLQLAENVTGAGHGDN